MKSKGINIKVKPLKVKPFFTPSINTLPKIPEIQSIPRTPITPRTPKEPPSFSNKFNTQKATVLPDAGNQPEPTRSQIEYYRQNREEIVGSIVKKSLHKHRQDVLHGSRSLQMIIPNYSKIPGDWDLFSPTEKKRALTLEASIDKKVGANIAETRHVPIPKISIGPDKPGTSKELYRVVTPDINNDAEIDVMDKPTGLKTISHAGITHEELNESYTKARTRMTRQPMKAGRALQDSREIEEHLRNKGQFTPKEESEFSLRTQHHFNLDSDRDGVPDFKDCKPFNPRMQHISKTMKRRIKKLPIYTSPTNIVGEKNEMPVRASPEIRKILDEEQHDLEKVASLMKSRDLPHIMSKEASPEAKRLFLYTVNKYPGVVSEIEKTKPKKVIVASGLQPKGESQKGWTSPTKEIYIGPQTPYESDAHRKNLAKTIYHELTHVKQLREKSMKEVIEEIELPFEERPMEIEAIEYSEEKMKEYHKGRRPSGKSITKTLNLEEY